MNLAQTHNYFGGAQSVLMCISCTYRFSAPLSALCSPEQTFIEGIFARKYHTYERHSLVLIPSVRLGTLSEWLSSASIPVITNLGARLLKMERDSSNSGGYEEEIGQLSFLLKSLNSAQALEMVQSAI